MYSRSKTSEYRVEHFIKLNNLFHGWDQSSAALKINMKIA